jgi:hypothetical protein
MCFSVVSIAAVVAICINQTDSDQTAVEDEVAPGAACDKTVATTKINMV